MHQHLGAWIPRIKLAVTTDLNQATLYVQTQDQQCNSGHELSWLALKVVTLGNLPIFWFVYRLVIISEWKNDVYEKKDSWMKYKSLVFLYTSCCSLVLCVPYWTFVAKLPPCVPGSWGALVTSGPLNPRSVEGSIWCSLNSVSSTLLNYYRKH